MSQLVRKVKVAGLLSLKSVAFEPGPLTVLIGANGAGKSNLLKALKLLPLLRTQSLQLFVGQEGGAASLLHYGPKTSQQLTLEIEFKTAAHTHTYYAKLGYAAGDGLVFLEESSALISDDDKAPESLELGKGHRESKLRDFAHSGAVAALNHNLGQMTFFHFHDTSLQSALRRHSRIEDHRFLRSDGSNLGAYLLLLSESDDERDMKAWRRINHYIRRIAPAIKSLSPVVVGLDTVRLDWIDDQDELFGVQHLSDGTLRAIALITALAQPNHRRPAFISIDEPELGLHPAALALIAELARSISRHTQILFATQSKALLDFFEPEEVVVVERVGGQSVLKRLDSQSLDRWLEDYSLAELFDKGVLGGRPQ